MAADLEKLVVQLSADVKQYERAMQRAVGITNRQARVVESRLSKMGKSTATQFALLGRTAAAGLAGALGAREIAQAASQYTNMTNVLRVSGLEGKALTDTFQQLFEIAQRNGTAIDPLVTLYSRLSQSQKELGASSEDLLKFTDGISVALRVGGTTAEQASGALLQLSQSLGGAVVRAEEFNSINEGARPILQAVANGLEEAGGSVSKLRSLVIDGKLSSEAFFRAFLAGMGGLQAQAAKAAGTTDQAITRLGNSFVALVGHLDQTTGASANAASSINSVAASIEGLPRFIDSALAGLGKLRSYLADFGNLPIWRRLGEAMGVDYSPEELAKLTGYDPNAGGKQAGSSRRGGATMARTGIETVSINDAPVVGTGDKAARVRLDSYERLTQAIAERTGALGAETAAQAGLNPLVNDYGFAVEKARAEYDLLQAAHEAGLTITPELEAQISGLASSYADASVSAARLAEAQGRIADAAADMNDLGRDVLGGFISDMREGVSAAQSLENALGKVADKLLDVALNSVFSPAGSGAGGLAGVVSQALGMSTGGAVSGSGGIGHAATGGRIRGPGTGTSDSVPMMLSDGEYVVRAKQAQRYGSLLEAINNGTVGKMAAGGFVAPTLPRISSARSGAAGGVAVSGPATPMNVVINNNAGASVSTQQTPSGGLQIDIDRMVEGAMIKQFQNRGRGAQALERSYGVRRKTA